MTLAELYISWSVAKLQLSMGALVNSIEVMTENADIDQELKLRAVHAQAVKDFYANRTDLRNPYARGTAEYNEYERAWTQALKKSNFQYESTATCTWYPEKEVKPYSPPAINEYERRKG